MNYPKQTAKLMHKNKRRQGLALAVCLALGVLSSLSMLRMHYWELSLR